MYHLTVHNKIQQNDGNIYKVAEIMSIPCHFQDVQGIYCNKTDTRPRFNQQLLMEVVILKWCPIVTM